MTRKALETFFLAYVGAALWASTDDSTNEPIDTNFTCDQIEPKTFKKMESDCLEFFVENGIARLSHKQQRQAGVDFWLTRNCHGAGFWDAEWPRPRGARLTESARAFGKFILNVGTDKRIHGTTISQTRVKRLRK